MKTTFIKGILLGTAIVALAGCPGKSNNSSNARLKANCTQFKNKMKLLMEENVQKASKEALFRSYLADYRSDSGSFQQFPDEIIKTQTRDEMLQDNDIKVDGVLNCIALTLNIFDEDQDGSDVAKITAASPDKLVARVKYDAKDTGGISGDFSLEFKFSDVNIKSQTFELNTLISVSLKDADGEILSEGSADQKTRYAWGKNLPETVSIKAAVIKNLPEEVTVPESISRSADEKSESDDILVSVSELEKIQESLAEYNRKLEEEN